MIHRSPDKHIAKGWFVGPWNSAVPIPVGYASMGVDDPHLHQHMAEIYLVAQGESTAVVGEQEIRLAAGDLLVVEPGERHTFTSSSADYWHFVIQVPFVPRDKVREAG